MGHCTTKRSRIYLGISFQKCKKVWMRKHGVRAALYKNHSPILNQSFKKRTQLRKPAIPSKQSAEKLSKNPHWYCMYSIWPSKSTFDDKTGYFDKWFQSCQRQNNLVGIPLDGILWSFWEDFLSLTLFWQVLWEAIINNSSLATDFQ
jgi:hypothetical protein